MILTVDKFCEYVETDINGLIEELSGINRVVSDEEKRAWMVSYKCVSMMFSKAMKENPKIANAQVSTTNVVPEYKLPASSSWCDLVLLGKGQGKNQVLIIELKNWEKNDADKPGKYTGLIRHKGHQALHPADQVKGYTEYCRNFHSAVVDSKVNVDGCVFFTQPIDLNPYMEYPNNILCKEYPLFNTKSTELLTKHVLSRIEEGDKKFATKFVNGYYKQNRNILKQVAESFQTSNNAKPFVLLEEQRHGFNLVMSNLEKLINKKKKKKEVIIVEGPPGSGKSAIAINIWIEASLKYAKQKDCGNIVYVTTSASQRDNWNDVFKTYGDNYSASGFILTANNFNPGMTGTTMKREYFPIFSEKGYKYISNKKTESLKYDYYEDYTNYMIEKGKAVNYKDNLHFLSIVDEAHALINPTAENFSTNKTAGWCFQMGPQAYHIIRESQVSVFLTDGKQSFRDNETTSVKDLRKLAKHLKAHVTKISLKDMQFRCAGSVEYVNWVEKLFTSSPLKNYNDWKDKFCIKIVDSPFDVDTYLKSKIDSKKESVRLLSSYTREWVSKGIGDYHRNNFEHDFILEDKNKREYRKYWNSTNQSFVQANGGTMNKDPLSEVGCPYVVRGFDYDHVGLLWLGDLVIRNGKWMIDFTQAQETANGSTKKQAREEQIQIQHLTTKQGKEIKLVRAQQKDAPKTLALFNTIVQAYRILMTRAIKSICIYIEDEETRKYVQSILK